MSNIPEPLWQELQEACQGSLGVRDMKDERVVRFRHAMAAIAPHFGIQIGTTENAYNNLIGRLDQTRPNWRGYPCPKVCASFPRRYAA